MSGLANITVNVDAPELIRMLERFIEHCAHKVKHWPEAPGNMSLTCVEESDKLKEFLNDKRLQAVWGTVLWNGYTDRYQEIADGALKLLQPVHASMMDSGHKTGFARLNPVPRLRKIKEYKTAKECLVDLQELAQAMKLGYSMRKLEDNSAEVGAMKFEGDSGAEGA